VILFDGRYRKSKWEFFKFLLKIRKYKYDIVIDAYGKLESNFVTLFSNAERRIGYDQKDKLFAYNIWVEHPDFPKTTDGLAIERRMNLFKGLMRDVPIDNKPRLFLKTEEIDVARKLFEKHNIDIENTNILMISVLGSEENTTYPIPYMVEVINFIAEQEGVKLLFNYTPAQKEKIITIYNLCSDKAKTKIEIGIIGNDLRSFMAIMELCSMHIGNDGGAINIAKALNKPTFTIFSPWIQKESWSIFEDGIFHKAVHINDFIPEIVSAESTKVLKKNYKYYYEMFKPFLIFTELKKFLENHISKQCTDF
jgi:heptosyltransferase-2